MKVTNITLDERKNVQTMRWRVGYKFGTKQQWRYFYNINKAKRFIKSLKTMITFTGKKKKKTFAKPFGLHISESPTAMDLLNERRTQDRTQKDYFRN